MFSAVVLACYALLPAGTPFIPLLGLLWLWQRGALQLPHLPRAIIALLLALALLMVFAVSLKGAIQFSLCLASVVIFARVAEVRVDRQLLTMTAIIAGFSIGAVTIHAIIGGTGFMFFLSEENEVRYRFLFSEPNIMMSFVFLPVIVCHAELRKMSLAVRTVIGIGLFIIAASGGSPLGYLGLLLYALNFLLGGGLATRAAGLASLVIIALFVTNLLPQNLATRVDAISSGGDNSLNFRTWGSLAIAETTLEDLGALARGVGIGAARQALDGNPYLVFFGADDSSVLPNYVATLLLETGIVGVVLVACLWASVLFYIRRTLPAVIGMIFIITNCCTSSFFLDYFSWAAFGLCLGIGHRAVSGAPNSAPARASQSH